MGDREDIEDEYETEHDKRKRKVSLFLKNLNLFEFSWLFTNSGWKKMTLFTINEISMAYRRAYVLFITLSSEIGTGC